MGGIALLWFLVFRPRRNKSGVLGNTTYAPEKSELGAEEKSMPPELHGQHRPHELDADGRCPVELAEIATVERSELQGE
jgi:hypothetical protein